MHLTARGSCRNACSFVAAFFSHHWCCFHASSFDFATSIGLPLWQHIVFNNFVATAGFKSIQSICKNVRECLQENKLNVNLQDFAKDLYPVSSSIRPFWSHGWLFWELDWGAQVFFWIFPPPVPPCEEFESGWSWGKVLLHHVLPESHWKLIFTYLFTSTSAAVLCPW